MNKIAILSLKVMRKFYASSFLEKPLSRPDCIKDPDEAAGIIRKAFLADKPCMIGRFGANEISVLVNYLGVKLRKKNSLSYIIGNTPAWWWNKGTINLLHTGAGFFPPTEEKIEQFCQLMLRDMQQVDILGSWLPNEHYFEDKLKDTKKVQLMLLDPYWAQKPWTSALEGKKVLVVHPFAETIKQQYTKRELLFENNLLPKFELKVIPAVQSIAGAKTPFADWFEALDFMKGKIDQTDYDICLIGAGAYGFPLAAHVKQIGKKGFHLGGSLQLLFGIKGKRWEDDQYHPFFNYSGLINQHWTSPNEQERPENANQVEGGCYW
jgi:hypothetical protein